MRSLLMLILFRLAVSEARDDDIENWPNMAHVQIKCVNETQETNTVGSASILNQQVLLTSASLLTICKEPKINVVIGHQYVEAIQKNISIFSYMIHEDYTNESTANDIALLKLENPIELGEHIQKVAIVRQASAKMGTMLGWVASTRIIMETELRLMSRSQCMNRLKTELPKDTFCGLLLEGQDPMSHHDLGGPLLIDKYIQIGITSNIVKQTVFYTNVSYHYDWIVTASKELLCSRAVGLVFPHDKENREERSTVEVIPSYEITLNE